MRWLRRWRERDDRSLTKSTLPLPDVDPIEELSRLIGEAQKRDAEDQRRFQSLARQKPTRRRPNGRRFPSD